MRVLIMSDMEGVSGIVVWQQVEASDSAIFQEARRLYTEEINAAVQGAKEAGATEIVVVDCHGAGEGYTFNSFIPDLLHPDCEWVSHHPWSRYTELLEQGCDAALMVGMHARAGTPDGVLCHTISTVRWKNLWFGDNLVGEFGINAALCGHYDCPVVLVTGDEAACREAAEIIPDIHQVAVKRGLSRYSARNKPPAIARELIRKGAKEALSRDFKKISPYKPSGIITVEVDTVDKTEEFRGLHGVKIPEPLKVISQADGWMQAWNQIWKYTV